MSREQVLELEPKQSPQPEHLAILLYSLPILSGTIFSVTAAERVLQFKKQ